MDPRVALPLLLPDAISWATSEASRVAAEGVALPPSAIDVARRAGVRDPAAIRVLVVDALPLPREPLREAAIRAGLLGPGMVGLTLGHSILVRRGHVTRQVLSHECRHVRQYESHGGIAGFLPVYLRQILDHGYAAAPFEADARRHEVRSTEPLDLAAGEATRACP